MRVLEWMTQRIDGGGAGVEHALGTSPRYEDLEWAGLGFSRDDYALITSVDPEAWRAELASHGDLLDKLRDRLPSQVDDTRRALAARLG